VHDAGKRGGVALGFERANVVGGTRTHDRQHALDRLKDAGDAPERERGRDERDHLAILGRGVPPNDMNRIGSRLGIIELGVQPVEHRLQIEDLHQSAINQQSAICNRGPQ